MSKIKLNNEQIYSPWRDLPHDFEQTDRHFEQSFAPGCFKYSVANLSNIKS